MASTITSIQPDISFLPPFISVGNSTGHLMNASLDYADNHVDQGLHPALSDSGITYSPSHDCFLDDSDHIDENALKEDQQAFADALQQYEDSAPPKLKTGIDLRKTHDWQEVIIQVEKARAEYKGMGKPGILRSIHGGFRSFTTAAPAIQAWLKLLPSTSWYGSILCGGLTIILEV